MSRWQIEYESMSSGFQKRTVVADRVSVNDNFLTFWEGLTPTVMVSLKDLVICIRLAEGGPVKVPRAWLPSEEEAPPPRTDERLRMRYDTSGDRIEMAAKELAQRLKDAPFSGDWRPTPKVTSAITPTAPTPPVYEKYPLPPLRPSEIAQGELGGRCA